MLKKIVIALLLLIAVASVGFLLRNSPLEGSLPPLPNFLSFLQPKVTLTYWGLWEQESIMQPLFSEFQKTHPNITVSYSKQSPTQYRERLQNAIAKGTGPDLFRFHNTWVPMLKSDLSPLPEKIMDSATFKATFYPIAEKDLTDQGKIYGLPLEIDTLALFYNEDLFQKAGASPPKTWEELRTVANNITVKDQDGRITIAGVALGTAGNVDHFSDILGLLFLQNGTDMEKVASSIGTDGHNLGEDALRFYTNFSVLDKVWDENQDHSIAAFANGSLAMVFGFSWDVFEVKNLNPALSFKVIPLPQLPQKENINWASYWVEGVSVRSKYQKEGWELLKFLSTKESLQKLYENESKLRTFGEPYSRIDLSESLAGDPLVSPFVEQAKTATSWYLSSKTLDNGVNDKMIKYFEDAVTGINNGMEVADALKTAELGVSQTLSLYSSSQKAP